MQKATARICVVLLACLFASPSLAAEGPWSTKEHSKIRVVALGPSPEDPEAYILGIHIQLQQGWETYWRTPGDAGVPPDFAFDDTENVDELYVDWPLPERKVSAGMITYVYQDEVLLPVTVYPHEPKEPVKFRMKITYAACREVCMLEEADLALDVMTTDRDPKLQALFDKHKSRMPILENTAELGVERVTAGTGPTGKPQVEIVARASTAWVDPQIIIEAQPGFAFRPATVYPTSDGKRIVLRSEYTNAEGKLLQQGETVVVTVYDKKRAIERVMLVYPPE